MMRELQKRRRMRNILYSKISLFVLILLLLIVGSSTLNVYDKKREAQKANSKISEEFNQLEQRSEELQTSINDLKTQKGIEKKIRENFGVVKEGERVIVVVEPKNQENSKSEKKLEEAGFWNKILGFFSQ